MLQNQRLTRYPSAKAGRPLPTPRPRRRRSPWRWVVSGVVLVLLLLLLAGGGMVALVLNGPVELGFLRGRINAAIESALGGRYDVAAGSATIGMDPALGLVLRVEDIVVSDPGKEIVAKVGSAIMSVDPLGVVTPRAFVRSAEVNDSWVSIVRSRNGHIFLGTAASQEPDEPDERPPAVDYGGGFHQLLGPVSDLDRALSGPLDAAAESGFTGFSASQTTLDIWDAAEGEQRRFERADLSVTLDPAKRRVSAALQASGYSGRWSATAERVVDGKTGARTYSAVFSQLTLADLFPAFGNEEGPVSTDIPFYGRATVDLAQDSAVESVVARLDLGAGNVSFRGGKDSILLDEASLKLRWDKDRDILIVEPSPFYFGVGRTLVTGSIRPVDEPERQRFAIDLRAQDATLAPRDSPAPPLVAQLEFAGVADFSARLITVDTATIVSPAGTVAAAGSIGMEGLRPSVAMAASISPMPAAALKQIWPPFLAGDSRRWVLKNINEGRIVSGQFEAEIPAGLLFNREHRPFPPETVRLDLELDNVGLNTFGGLPAIRGAKGRAVLVGSAFGVDLQDGELTTPAGRKVTMSAGAFAVENTAQRTPEGQLALQLSGSAAALAEVANAEPLRALRGRNIAPGSLSGRGDARITANWPLQPDLTSSDFDWQVSVDIHDLAADAPLEGRMVKNANVTLAVDPVQVTIKGAAEIDGVPARVDLSFPIDGASSGGRQQVRLALDEAARKRLGIGMEDFLGGTLAASVSDLGNGKPGQHYELDLKQSRIVLAPLGWSKGVGVPATLTFDMIPTDAGYDIRNMVLSGDGFGMRGEVKMSKDFALLSARISNFGLRKGDSVSLELGRDDGGYVISAEGQSFDVRGMLARLKDSVETADDGLGLAFTARIGKLVGFNGETITDARLALRSKGGKVMRFEVGGELGGGTVTAAYSDPGRGASIDVAAANAGAVFRFINLYQRVEGGALRLAGRQADRGPLEGAFDVSDFSVVGEAAMTRLVSTTGPDAVPNGLNPGRIVFDRMNVNFAWRNGVIVIEDALLRGPAVGATWAGSIDLGKASLSITGTYLPAYRVNNMFGQIPIIGLALGAGAREGLLGVTFKIDGPLSGVRVAINPLSAIAPGIFRKIFEFQ